MADATTTATTGVAASSPPGLQAAPGDPPVQTIQVPGTPIQTPVGGGVESLQAVTTPFKSNGPVWFTPPDANGNPSVWSQLGCAVAQPGAYLQTQNQVLYDFVREGYRALFQIMWFYDTRKFEGYPGVDCLYACCQSLINARNRLQAKTPASNQTPMVPTKATPNYKMFLCSPVPLFGPLGCPNTWLADFCTYSLMAFTEAMQHSDNERSFYITPDCFQVLYGYIKFMLMDLATRWLGDTVANASSDTYVPAATLWQAYNPAQTQIGVAGTTNRYPPGLQPDSASLESIRDLPVERVIPFLQQWPDASLKFASGGIWAPLVSQPTSGTPTAVAATGQPSIYSTFGPPPPPTRAA